jgi:PAS domain S-box-containing protein
MPYFAFPGSHEGPQVLQQQVWVTLAAAVLLGGSFFLPLDLIFVPLHTYVPIHTTLEFLAMLIAGLVVATVWFTPTREVSPSAVVIASALIATTMLDFLHVMSINGMGDFITPASSQKGIAFWIAARTCATTGFLVGAFIPRSVIVQRKIRNRLGLGCMVLAAVVAYIVLAYESWAPVFFIAGKGTTPLKATWEVVLSGILCAAAWRFYMTARSSEESYNALMFGAVAFSALGELFFTSYTVANDAQNLLGHLYKIMSYWLIFQAIYILSARKPYERLNLQTQQLAQLNESLRAQSLALDSTATPVLITDVNGEVHWRNRASRAITPRIPEAQNSLFGRYFTPDPSEAILMRNKLAIGEVWRGQVKMVLTNGNEVIMDRTVTPVRNAQGTVEGYVAVSENITENVRTQTRHKRILETAMDGLWIMDAEGKILEVNDAYVRMSGYTRAELQQMRLPDLKFSEDVDVVQNKMTDIRQLGYGRYKSRQRHKDGHALIVEVSVTYDAESDRFYKFIRDLTEQELASAAKQELERQLQHAQKMQALGQLTGGIAHDFNNILASILGYSNLALSRFASDGEPKLTKYLKEITAASERARDLILKMLAFTRTEAAGPASLISPATVVRNVEEMLRPAIPAYVQLRCVIESEQPVRIEAGDLNQILVNLVINARDAISGVGLITIRVRSVRLEDAVCAISRQRLHGDFLAVEVSDNGTGISPANLGNVFNPFFTTKDVGKGTGLGLSIVQGILQKCGSHVVVSSQLGHGSQFQLLFPTEPQPPVPEVTGHRITAAVRSKTGQSIWVVDDEIAVAGFVRELLTEEGYSVRTFHNPLDAIGAFKLAPASMDVLITDQTMPGLSGLQLVDLIRAIRKDLPVIICTGYSDGIPAGDLEAHGIERLLIKPIAAGNLLDAIDDVLADTTGAAK